MKKIFIILIIILLAFAGCSVLISKLQGMLPPQNTTFKTFEINLTNETFTTNLDTIILGRPSQPIKHPPLEDVRVECSVRVCSTSLCQVDYHESVSLKTIAKKTAQVCDNTY
ncbi:MAG: hypothetical protein Q8O03_03695, partial [Nanoarchaeota archaeon]|nr:hypothetical protein [Nanoarchaeota archaeon]